MTNASFMQVLKFAAVGVLAAAVHFSVVVILVQTFAYAPLVANVIAFMIAFQVSYWGHRGWTFYGTEVEHKEAYTKLIVLQVSMFCLNEGMYYALLSMGVQYQLALFIVLAILPIVTFFTSKFWVFQH